jgi:uncharacterized protein YhaN
VKITDVKIDGFGIWSDLTIDQVGEHLTVFYGPNEAGKTTLMQFIRAVLYGYSGERRQYMPPVYGGVAGGKLTIQSMNGQYEIIRQGPNTDHPDDRGALDLFSSDGSLQRDHLLDTLLSNLDEPIFNNVFAIGLRELQELATLNETDAAEQLYKLSSGLDRVSLVDVLRELETARDAISGSKDIRSKLAQALHERDRLRAQIEDRANAGRRWGKLSSDLTLMTEELRDKQSRITVEQRRSKLMETALQVEERWRERAHVAMQMEQSRPTQQVTEDALEKLDQFNSLIGERQKRLKTIRDQRTTIREEAATIPINRELWNHRSRIEALQEHGPWLSSLSKHVHRLDAEIQLLNTEVEGASHDQLPATAHDSTTSPRGDGSWQTGDESTPLADGDLRSQIPDRTELTDESIDMLRKSARAAKEATRQLQEAKDSQNQCARSVESIDSHMEREFQDIGGSNIAVALRERGDLVSRLRRRIQLEERLERMNRSRNEAEEDCLDLLDAPDLPLVQFAACAGLLSVGVLVFLMPWFFESFADDGTLLRVAGGAITVVALLLKFYFQKLTGDELEDLQSQLDQLKTQIKKTEDERDHLNASLPQQSGTPEVHLQAAERELERLESLAPIETDHRAAHQRMDEVQQRLDRVETEVRDTRERWRATLRRYRLPENLTPKSIKQLIDSHSRISELQHRLEEKQRERNQRVEDVERLKQRIEEIMLEVGIEFQSDDPHELLRELSGCLAEQRRLVDRRNVLKKRDRELLRQRHKFQNSLERTKLRKQAVISRHGLDEESELRELAAQLNRYLRHEKEHRDLCERIRVLIGRQFTEEEVDEVLEGDSSLEARWEQCATDVENLQDQINQLHTKKGEVQHEMKTLAADRDLARASVELQGVEAQIERLKEQWQLLAAIGYVLESIRKIYETERQPETLNDASRYLAAFTEGKYTRVWTPLGENVLRVDDAHDNPLSVETLSTGTREAVFLSLRMALVAAYARRGAVLPLILDDVMVNLDVHRAQAAVCVLHEFANAGHQIMLFTCHEHIMRMFDAEGVEVRTLPLHSDLVAKKIGRLSVVDIGLTDADVEVIEDQEAAVDAMAAEELAEQEVDELNSVGEEIDIQDSDEELIDQEETADDEFEEVDVEDTTDEELEDAFADDQLEEDDDREQELEDATDDAEGVDVSIADLERPAAELIAERSELISEYSQVGEEHGSGEPNGKSTSQWRDTPALAGNAQDMWWDIDVA